MKKNNTKELLISILESQNSGLLLEDEGATGDNKPVKPVAGNQEVDDPDKNVANPNADVITEENYGSRNSLLFLTSPNPSGIIKSGENMGWVELTKENISKNGIDIDLVDFQWICPTDQFNDYLKNTGRYYDEDTGEWAVREEEEYEDKTRKINSYDDFIAEKLNRKDELNESLFGDIGANQTEKGMSWQGDDPDFQGGKLNDAQRKFVKFYFARNNLRNTKKLEYKLDLTTLKVGQTLQLFVCPFDAKTGKSDTTANIGVTFTVTAIIEASGDIKIPMVIGTISQVVPNIGKSETGVDSVLDAIVKGMEGYFEKLKEVLSSSTGLIFASTAAIASMWKGGIIKGIAVWITIGSFRRILRGAMLSKEALEASKLASAARGGNFFLRSARAIGQGSVRIFNFIKYPVSVVKNIKVLRDWNKFFKGSFTGWRAVNQILFGHKALKVAKAATVGAKILKGASTVGKWSNPIGWVLLIGDAIGSALNYTSDKQAPSWDPILGDDTDALINYKRKGITSGATNVFQPGKIANGESITLCWTQSPEDGWGIALSFVASNTTRTTMNITKIHSFDDLSMFIVHSINYKGDISKQLNEFDLKFLFIQDGTYEEGYADDNIPAVFLGAKSNPKAEAALPIAYYAHCDFVTFADTYEAMKDQLVYIPDEAPETYNFYFEDSESNIINVYGKKVTDQDIENASQEEIRSFFDVQPVSSLIGNPESETEEEKEQRLAMENSAKSLSSSEEDDQEENAEGKGDLASVEKSANESYDTKWYSSINESKPVTSFDDFRSLKESILLEKDPPLPGKEFVKAVELPTEVGGEESEGTEEKKPETQTGSSVRETLTDAKELQENFENILQTIDEPMAFCIYFVELREYADPKLRDTYKPGSFMNFTIDGKALSASNDSNIEGHVQVNNLDVLLEVRKGTYTYTEKDNQEVNKDSEENGQEGSAEGGQVRTSLLGKSGKISIDKEEEGFAKKEEDEEIKSVIQRVSPEELSKLDIAGWQDVTSVKIIRDKNGEPETVKIKNAKADLNDKSRRFDRGDAGFEEALRLSKAYQDQKSEEEERLLAKR